MKTLNIVLLVAIMTCIPLVMLFAAPTKPTEKPLRDLTIEELLSRLQTSGPNQTEAFDAFVTKFMALYPQMDKLCITYRGYGFQEGLMLNFAPPARPDLVVVPLGPAIMSQLDLKGGVIVYNVKGDMKSVSGLQENDIVYSVNGTDITHVASFNKALGKCRPDETCTFKILRGGKSEELSFNYPPLP